MSVLESDERNGPSRSSMSQPAEAAMAARVEHPESSGESPLEEQRAEQPALRPRDRSQRAAPRAAQRAEEQAQRKARQQLKTQQRTEAQGARAEQRSARRSSGEPALQAADSKRTYKSARVRREQILDCALGAFAERGYHGASIGDICKRANIGRATLYQYFTDKQAVLLALVERIYNRVVSEFERRQPLSVAGALVQRPTREQGVAFMRERLVTLLAVVFEDEATTRLVLRAARGADGVVDQVLRRLDDVVLDSIEAELSLAVEAGLVRPLDVGFVARFFVGGLEKVVMRCIDDERPLDIQKIASEAALLEGIGILAE